MKASRQALLLRILIGEDDRDDGRPPSGPVFLFRLHRRQSLTVGACLVQWLHGAPTTKAAEPN
jgi:hypothetical protein